MRADLTRGACVNSSRSEGGIPQARSEGDLRNGTTCFLEAGSVFEPDATARASEEIGIRALVADGFVWDIGPLAQGPTRLERTPATTQEAIDRLGTQLYRNDDPEALVRGHIAIWGMGTASDDLYAAAKSIATDADVVVNAHQSFANLDADGDLERLGTPPICHFHDLGVLDRRTTLAHVNFVNDAEVGRLVESGTSVAWCPAVSMIWATGGAVGGRHAELHRRGCNVSLGSDSSIVANPLDLTQAGMLGALVTRDVTRRRESLTAEDILEMCTLNGARAVGLDKEIGSLTPGKRADIVIRAEDIAEFHPPGEVVAQLVFAGSTRGVDSVIVNGRIVLEHGVFPHLDEHHLRSMGDAASRRVFDRMGWRSEPRWPHIPA
jgi:5-methylthioadenosine/S-adenosylhomocysteine deaminase